MTKQVMAMEKVAVVMGSKSDRQMLDDCFLYLQWFGIDVEEKVLSAHRHPGAVAEFARDAEAAGYAVLIAAAGMAAHLAGALAAHTNLPVIGVPLAVEPLQGFDSLLSTVQMPPGVPVATVTVGEAGAANAAVLAAQILAVKYPKLRARLREFKNAGARL